MATEDVCPALVTCEWLRKQITNGNQDITILDCTFTEGGPGEENFNKNHIPSAQFLDLTTISRPEPYIPSSLPAVEVFQAKLRALGVNNNSHVILYETAALMPFAGPRVWWLMRAFGHKRVSLLNGGFKKWQAERFPVTDEVTPAKEGDVTLSRNQSLMITYEQLKDILSKGDYQVLDTRPHENYTAQEEEPSTLLKVIFPSLGVPDHSNMHLKTGAMPGAKNLPYPLLYTSDLVSTRPENELQELFSWAKVDLKKPLLTTCYVGYTACYVALAAYICGNTEVPVYYGSWLEYGQRAAQDQVKPGPKADDEPPYSFQMPVAQL